MKWFMRILGILICLGSALLLVVSWAAVFGILFGAFLVWRSIKPMKKFQECIPAPHVAIALEPSTDLSEDDTIEDGECIERFYVAVTPTTGEAFHIEACADSEEKAIAAVMRHPGIASCSIEHGQ